MKIIFRRITALLLTILLVLNCAAPAFAAETSDNKTDDSLPQTGDRLLTRLKIMGFIILTSAALLLLLNYRKRI